MPNVRIALTAIAAGAFAFMTAVTGTTVWADSTKAFKASDMNKDGHIDREEYHRRMMDLYFFVDEDKNGVIVIGELKKVSPGDFNAADRNKDGKLSSDEFTNSYFLDFRAADTNSDGKLSAEEVKNWEKKH